MYEYMNVFPITGNNMYGKNKLFIGQEKRKQTRAAETTGKVYIIHT